MRYSTYLKFLLKMIFEKAFGQEKDELGMTEQQLANKAKLNVSTI